MPDTAPFDPPFDLPYTTTYHTEEGVRVVEMLADGTTREVTPVATRDLRSQAKQRSPLPSKGRAPTAAAESKPVPDANLLPGDRRAVLFLDVPFAEKDDVKRMGTKWDAAMRKWYVPHGIDINLFGRWWPEALKQKTKAFGKL